MDEHDGDIDAAIQTAAGRTKRAQERVAQRIANDQLPPLPLTEVTEQRAEDLEELSEQARESDRKR